jgi:excisionase family DNA binding protein
MFWTVKQTASYLGLELHQVYYLLFMGDIEAVRVGRIWRVMPDSARAYGAKMAA